MGSDQSTISDEYRSLLAMFIKEEIIQSQAVADIDPSNASLYKNIAEIDVGGRCENLLAKQSLGDKETRFRHYTLAFLNELCVQIKKRFPFEQTCVFAQLSLLSVEDALSTENRKSKTLASYFPTIVSESELEDLKDQWKQLPHARGSEKYG